MMDVLLWFLSIGFSVFFMAWIHKSGKYSALASELSETDRQCKLYLARSERQEDVIKRQQEESAEWQKKWQEANGKANFSQKQLHSLMEDLRGKETKLQYAEEERDHLAKTCQTMEEVTRKQSTAYQQLQSVLAEKDRELAETRQVASNRLTDRQNDRHLIKDSLRDISEIINNVEAEWLATSPVPKEPEKQVPVYEDIPF